MAWSDATIVTLPGFLAGLLVGALFMASMPSLSERYGGVNIEGAGLRWGGSGGGQGDASGKTVIPSQEIMQEDAATLHGIPTTSIEIEDRVQPGGLLGNVKGLEAYFQSKGLPSCVKKVETSAEGKTSAEVACQDWMLPDEGKPKAEDAWYMMKWVERPSLCRVRGFAIEMLDPANNFRRGYALDFVMDPEDRTLLPAFFLANQDLSLQTRKRRVFVDLGGKTFSSSTDWFLRRYPLDFTEVHAFEMQEGLYEIPSEHPPEMEELLPMDISSRRRPSNYSGKPAPIPNWMLPRIKFYQAMVSNKDGTTRLKGASVTEINITRFMKEDLALTSKDAVIVKMDIEGWEWDILPEWATDPEMLGIVDEVFVEVHYQHPTMTNFNWMKFKHDRNEAAQLLNHLRSRGLFVHFWP
eukprot:TRINITY_DN405_c0_g1_i1.p1 TRINITY_DN405_c0_g1~~TRINITY_DN405_c0_g1_i1.p1  ORF type:complete len:410 (+),score=40.08 TRINITY_DN405_c0_g1_i1:142-1371(+)